MELDDLRQALVRLDRRLEDQAAVAVDLSRRDARSRLEHSLRPLGRGQWWQIAAGAVTAFVGVAAWRGTDPAAVGPFASGLILHGYGIAMIVFGAVTATLLGTIDWSQPVLGIQRRLAAVRRAQVVATIAIGLSWCVLWIPAVVAAAYLAWGIDITRSSPSTWLWLTAVGAGLIAAVWLFHRWAAATGRRWITDAFDSVFTAEPLGRALADLDDIRRFERE